MKHAIHPDTDFYVQTGGGNHGRVETPFASANNAVEFAKRMHTRSGMVYAHPVLYYRGIVNWMAFIPLGDGLIRSYERDRKIVRHRVKAATA